MNSNDPFGNKVSIHVAVVWLPDSISYHLMPIPIAIALRANICETVLVLLINVQGEKDKGSLKVKVVGIELEKSSVDQISAPGSLGISK